MAQRVVTAVLLKMMLFKIAQTVFQIFRLLFCNQELLKIAQSGHSADVDEDQVEH